MRKKGKSLFTVDQYTHVEGMMVFENHHFATITVITDFAQNHQWMLKLVGERLLKNRILPQSQNIPNEIFINYKAKISNFRVD